MHKCNKCDTEFEGKFCPECGTKFSAEKTCPDCGATLSASVKFCNECGHSFIGNPAPEPAPKKERRHKSAKSNAAPNSQKFYAILKKVYDCFTAIPAVLFATFSVLLFLIFLGDMGKLYLFGISASSMNLYGQLASNELGMLPTCAALVAFAALSVIFSAFMLKAVFTADRAKTLKIGKLKMTCPTFLTFISFVLYSAVLILGCIAAAQVADFGLEIGNCPVCVIVFSLLFGLFSGGALIVKWRLDKIFPDWKAEEKTKLNAIAEKAEKKKNSYDPTAQTHMQTLHSIQAVIRRKTAVLTCFLSFLCPLVGLIGMIASFTKKIPQHKIEQAWNDRWTTSTKRYFIGFAIPSLILGSIFAAVTFIYISGAGYGSLNEFRVHSPTSYTSLIVFSCYFGITAACLFSGAVIGFGTVPHQPSIPMETIFQTENQCVLGKVNVRKLHDNLLISILCVILSIILIAISCMMANIFGNKLSLSLIDKVEINTNDYKIEQIFGKPDEKTDSEYVYYSSNYLNLKKEAEELKKDMEEAFIKGDFKTLAKLENQSAALKEKANNLIYQSLSIIFEKESVIEVIFDNACKANSASHGKTVKEIELSKNRLVIDYNFTSINELDISAKIYYEDGSYRHYILSDSVSAQINITDNEKCTLSWRDDWGTYDHEVTVEVRK